MILCLREQSPSSIRCKCATTPAIGPSIPILVAACTTFLHPITDMYGTGPASFLCSPSCGVHLITKCLSPAEVWPVCTATSAVAYTATVLLDELHCDGDPSQLICLLAGCRITAPKRNTCRHRIWLVEETRHSW